MELSIERSHLTLFRSQVTKTPEYADLAVTSLIVNVFDDESALPVDESVGTDPFVYLA